MLGTGDVGPPLFFTSALDGERSVSLPWCFTPRYHLVVRLGKPKAGLHSMDKRKSFPYQESNPSRPALARSHTDSCPGSVLYDKKGAETCREYRGYIIKYFVNCCEKEGVIYS
jgi:hypothetical protein